MDEKLLAYVTLVSTSAVLNLFLCFYGYLKKHQYPNIATYFILNTATTAIYCFGYAFSLTSTTLEQIQFWNVVQYIGLPFAPLFGLLLVMQYLGMIVSKRKLIVLLIIPVLTLLFDATNPLHHLIYRSYELDPLLGAPYIYKEYGIWFVVHGIYLFSCLLAAFILLLSRWKETAISYRPQILALMCGQLVPMVTAFIYLMNLTPEGIDPVPMVIWISSALFLWSIHYSRMLSILPIAKETIFNSITDGVIVLDESRRLIEYNQACQNMLPALNRTMFGQRIETLWQQLSAEPFPHESQIVGAVKDLHLTLDGKKFIYQVRTSAFTQGNKQTGLLIIFTNMTQLKLLQQQLERQAYYDELTDIYNRRAFFQKAEQAFTAAKNEQRPFTVILFDIDHFKKVNDTYGHQIGDQLLIHIATLLRTWQKPHTIYARYGGEEFVIALPGYTLAQGEAAADELRGQIEATPLLINQNAIAVTSSFGVSTIAGSRAEEDAAVGEYTGAWRKGEWQQVLQYADEALYEAKRTGRNLVQSYTRKEQQ